MVHGKLGNFPFFAAIASLCLILPAMPGHAQVDDLHAPSQQALAAPIHITADFKWRSVIVHWQNVNNPSIAEYHVFRLENYAPDKTLKWIGTVPQDKSTPKRV